MRWGLRFIIIVLIQEDLKVEPFADDLTKATLFPSKLQFERKAEAPCEDHKIMGELRLNYG